MIKGKVFKVDNDDIFYTTEDPDTGVVTAHHDVDLDGIQKGDYLDCELLISSPVFEVLEVVSKQEVKVKKMPELFTKSLKEGVIL